MEWLTAIWEKINKPQHLLAAGFVILMAAPSEIKWAGWIFIAIGSVGIGEWLFVQLRKLYSSHKLGKKIVDSLPSLNKDERLILQRQLAKNEKTFYFHALSTNSLADHMFKSSVIVGLASKGFLKLNQATTDGKSTTVHITDQAWDLLQKPENVKLLDEQ